MARIDPNQAAAAAQGQPIPGADPLGQTIIDMQTQVPTTMTVSADLIAQAESLGLNPQAMRPEEWEFVSSFAQGQLDALPPSSADPDNPLIPGENDPVVPATAPVVPTTQPTADVPPLATGADDRVGPATTPDGSVEVPTSEPPAVTSTPIPEALETPGRPAFQIPSPLPPAPNAPPEPTPLQPGLVQLPDGSVVTYDTYQQILAAQQQAQPFAQQQPVPPYAAPPSMAPPAPMVPQGYAQPNAQGFVPNAWTATPGEWVDDRAQLEFQQQQQQIAAMQAEVQRAQAAAAAAIEATQANTRQALDTAVEETLHGYANARGITYEETEGLLTSAVQLGLVGVYSQMYPGDPRRATAAAIENMYNNTPEYRELEIQRQIETTRAQNDEVDRKKAFAAQTTGTPGSVPRVAAPAAPGDRQAQTQGMVALIEADPAYQAQQAQRR